MIHSQLDAAVKRHGLDLWGVAKIAAPGSKQAYFDWLDADMHGEMSYMKT